MRWALLTIGALLFAGCTASAEQSASRQAEADRDLAKAIGDRKAGTPVDCINSVMVAFSVDSSVFSRRICRFNIAQ